MKFYGAICILFLVQNVHSAPVPQYQTKHLDPSGKTVIGIHSSPAVRVNSLYAISPYQKAGGKVGDVITKIGGTKVTSIDELVGTLSLYRPGATVKVEIKRNNKVQILDVTLGQEDHVVNPMPLPRKIQK